MDVSRISQVLFQLRREWLPSGRREELEAEVTGIITEQAARIAALEAEVEALKNPPYRVTVELDRYPEYSNSDILYRATVLLGNDPLPFEMDWHDAEAEARAEAGKIIDKLTAPFAPKGE